MNKNRIQYYSVLLLAALFIQVTTIAQSKKPLRVLLIGNSFSQNATRYLPAIAKEKGYTIELGHAEPGGCSLQRHWDSVAVSITDTSRGKLYKTGSLRNLLTDGIWDIVTIQQYSLLSGDSTTFYPYATQLIQFIKQFQPNAKILIHETWAYRSDAKSFGHIKGTVKATNQEEMYHHLRASYHFLAKQTGLSIIPVGDAFYAVAIDPTWHFVKDETFAEATAIYPNLPTEKNSLNVGYSWSNDKNIRFDANHANEAGCYLGGLIWYGVLFNKDPREVQFSPDKVSKEFATFLKQTAANAINKNKQ